MIVVERLFRCRIDYEVETDYSKPQTQDPLTKISKKAHDWASAANVEITDNTGGPCWNAYFTFEGPDESAVREVAEKVERFIKRFRGAKIHE